VEAGRTGVGARQSQDHRSTKDSDDDGSETKKTKGMRSPPTRLTLFIGGPSNLSVAAPCSVQHGPTTLSREVHEKNEADFSLTDQVLRPKSGFSS
jgi:hypothetical protein